MTVIKLAAILRVADALDRSHSQRIKHIQIKRLDDEFIIETPGLDDPTVEQLAIDASVANWNNHMRMVDAQLLSTGAYMAGETFTLADIVIGLSTNRWFMTSMQRPELPAVQAYYDRLNQRLGYQVHGRNGTP